MQNYKYIRIPWLTGNPVEISNTDRFGDEERAREATPYPNKMVAHSLGGSVAIEQQKERGGLISNLYGTPYSDPWDEGACSEFLKQILKESLVRYRNAVDPVSALDSSAKTS